MTTEREPREPVEEVLQVGGRRVATLRWGPPDGPPVLALHGWLDNAASFERLAPLLPRLRIVAVDLPGHGFSEWRPGTGAYLFVEWIPDVFDIADALGWERFTLLGHSMGAGISSLAAGVVPERVERLLLVEGLGAFADAASEAPHRVVAYLADRRRSAARAEPPVYPSRAFIASRVAESVPGLTEDAAAVLVARGTREIAGGFTWRADPRLRWTSPLRFTEDQIHAFLRRITAPTLVVLGEGGWAFPEDRMAARLACVPHARLARVPGGHHPHLVAPERVAAVIDGFVAQHS